MSQRVVVVGQGYVGLPLAVRAAAVGLDVVGYDVDERRVAGLQEGRSYVEDVSDADLEAVSTAGRYVATTDSSRLDGFDVAIVTVPTPLMDGAPDLSFIEASAETLGRWLRPGSMVVLESTTYPGTTEDVFGPILERGSGLVAGRDFHLGYSPERIDPGNQVWTFERTPKIVSGINAASCQAVADFYSQIVETVVSVDGTREAELAKLLENTFRHVNIALVNELAIYANQLGIDVWAAIEAASTKPFGFMKFSPGPGVGGHCLPVDPAYLGWRVKRETGQAFRFVDLANDINDHMPRYVVQRVAHSLNERRKSVNGARILVLGFTYKPNSGDIRETPCHPIVEQLLSLGGDVTVVDPFVASATALPDGAHLGDHRDPGSGYDLAVQLTHHDDFALVDWTRHAEAVLDTRGRFTPAPNVELL